VVARAADTNVFAFAITAITAILVYFTRIHPLLPLACGAALGIAGLA
jgi:hypothetical protein